jgi:predicted MFS family arabinose efflux permease
VTWNISNVGAVAVPLADAYEVRLATVGLFTTALFVTHLLVQVPAGRGADRLGARTVAFAALAAAGLGNALLLLEPSVPIAILGRGVVGLGSGAGFVAGAEYMRSVRPSPVLQGLYGGSTMLGGALAIAIVPQLEPALGWRAPYWSGLAVAAATAAVLAVSRYQVRGAAARVALVADRRLLRLAVVHGTTFGVAVVAANWIVPLLERQGHPRGTSAVLGSLVLLVGIVTRPLGGLVAEDRRAVATAIAVLAGALAALALTLPLAVAGVAAAVAGLAAGVPFAFVFAGAQRTRPDDPAAAVGYVNAWAIAVVVVGTPLLGLTFSLRGDGRLGFACLAALAATALLAVARW